MDESDTDLLALIPKHGFENELPGKLVVYSASFVTAGEASQGRDGL